MSRIGVFGGAFDPIHTGHLAVAQDVVQALQLERLLFVPTGRPPHGKVGPFATAEARVAMVEAATDGDERFAVWKGELEREGPSYTVDTLRSLSVEYPGSALCLVMGADQFSTFMGWRSPEEIMQLAHIVVVGRSGNDGSETTHGVEHTRVQVPRIEISSSDIRERIEAGRPIRYLVPDSVYRIIEEHGWYKSGLFTASV